MYDVDDYTGGLTARPRDFKCSVKVRDAARRGVMERERERVLAEKFMEAYPAYDFREGSMGVYRTYAMCGERKLILTNVDAFHVGRVVAVVEGVEEPSICDTEVRSRLLRMQ
jgi:hypothetical protein